MAAELTCARIGCTETESVTYYKPLCRPHWREFDRYELFECERCGRFDEVIGAVTDESICFDCARGDTVAVHHHGPVEYRVRYLYILKLDGGRFYVGQTNDLELRLQEHRDGTHWETAKGNPILVWFERWHGDQKGLNEEEYELQSLARDNTRSIRRMVAEWQRPLRLVNLDA